MKNQFLDKWNYRRELAESVIGRDKVLITFIPTKKNGRVHVICPKDSNFIARAKELGGIYKFRSLAWSFPGPAIRLVIEICQIVFGPENIETKGVS